MCVCVGLCPDWEDWSPTECTANATEAMDAAEQWLDIPQVAYILQRSTLDTSFVRLESGRRLTLDNFIRSLTASRFHVNVLLTNSPVIMLTSVGYIGGSRIVLRVVRFLAQQIR